jgi:hypothetical protein
MSGYRPFRLSVLALLLSACAAPLLVLPTQGQLMLALLEPLVGFDPNTVNLFEQPPVRQRMTALLGARYDAALQVLRTADQLKREGPLFYVVSRYTPIPELLEGAGLVWNSDTNQLAALLYKGDTREIFAETVARKVEAGAEAAVRTVTPVWPLEPWLPSIVQTLAPAVRGDVPESVDRPELP